MRLALYGLASTAMAASVVVGAFRQRANFYAASVYLSKSNACMMILCNYGIFLAILTSRLLIAVFFGTLRAIELERLHDRLWFTVTETLLALAMFRDEFDAGFVVMFVSLILIKCFHWLASDRVEWMEQTTTPPSKVFHVRMTSALASLWLVDTLFIIYTSESVLLEGATVILMFAMEYLILMATCWSIIAKYSLNLYALHLAAQRRQRQLVRPPPGSDAESTDSEAENAIAGGGGPGTAATSGWERKSAYVFYVDLLTDLLKLTIYVTFLSLSLTLFSLSLPVNVLRDVYFTLRSFLNRCANLNRWTRATRDMRTRYPDATRTEMDGLEDKTCIICRDDMEHGEVRAARRAAEAAAAAAAAVGSSTDDGGSPPPPPRRRRRPRTGPPRTRSTTPKKLPCGHIFHLHCLRSWLERQQTCPTCRRPVLDTSVPPPAAPEGPAAAPVPPPTAPPAPPTAAPSSPLVARPPAGPSSDQPRHLRRPPPLQPPGSSSRPTSLHPSPAVERGPHAAADTLPRPPFGPSSAGFPFGPVQTPETNPLLRFEVPPWSPVGLEADDAVPTPPSPPAPNAATGSLLDEVQATPRAARRPAPNLPAATPPAGLDEFFPFVDRSGRGRSRERERERNGDEVVIPLFDTETGEVPVAFRGFGRDGLHRVRGPGLGEGEGEGEGEGWSQAEVDAATEVTKRQLVRQLRLLVQVKQTIDRCTEQLEEAGVRLSPEGVAEATGRSGDVKGKHPVEGIRARRGSTGGA